ncbi:trigger factor [Chengkuizengella axinellae]|uniref:Trigger factor n=1 Tax=Chengkuizengella axinellae TaxID=3064388 RepID=A0ABT9IUA6_9BACL|nr:trigger factor [Chengkuizengella sp. 2205SS18-9]MDP5272672.1 trigger factor [Chengkuizengella sp. 2205SS18-9]
MKASWEKLEKNEGVLTVEVDESQVAEALDQAFKKVAQKTNVPGFRKGKVPRQVFEARFGVESLYQDALDIILPVAYTDAIQETKIDPIDRPEIDIQQFEKNQPLKFTAKVQVKPEVTLGEYKGLEIPEKEFSVTEEAVEQELKTNQDRHAELIVVEEGATEKGDTVIIDFEGFVDDEPFEGGKAENYSLELGSGSFIPGFEEQVEGMSKDDEKDVEVTFPEQYQAENLAGKPAVFKVKLHEIKRKKLPELDDEFAKDVSEYETLAEYKEDIKKRLQEAKDKEEDQYRESTVVEKATEVSQVEIPQVMIDTETNHMIEDFQNRLKMQGMTLEMYYQFSGQDEAALKEQMKNDAEKRVNQSLVLEAITTNENIGVTEEELNEELEKLASMYQKTAEELKSIFTANGNIESLKQDIANRKSIQLLLENSVNVPAVEEVAEKAEETVEE